MDKIEKWYNKEYLLFILGIAITLYNTVNLQQNTVLLLSVPQYILVFYYIFNKDFRTAFLLHAVFTIACVSGGIYIEEGVSPFLYTKCRIYGPLTFNIIILVTLWLAVQRSAVNLNKDSLLLKVRNTILYLLVSGALIGFIGCLLIKHYDWRYLGLRILFVGEFFLFIDIFVRLYSEKFSKLFALVTICMMAASPVASVISFSALGVQAFYGYEAMPFYNPILALCPSLIIALFQLKNGKLKTISLIGLVFYVLHILILSRGSQFLDIFVALLLMVYLVYFKRNVNFQLKSMRLLLPVLIIAFIPLAIESIIAASDVSLNKFEQFTSLFTIFNPSNSGISFNLDDVGRSPYIRLAELSLIIDAGKHNIFQLIFGQGFGGFYTDSLHMFAGIDLTRGAFSDEVVASGRFYNAHSAIPSVLQYNGIIGLFLMFRLAFYYIRIVDKSFLVFAAFVLFVQTFYFDLNGCIAFVMALFGAEYLISGASKEMPIK